MLILTVILGFGTSINAQTSQYFEVDGLRYGIRNNGTDYTVNVGQLEEWGSMSMCNLVIPATVVNPNDSCTFIQLWLLEVGRQDFTVWELQ